jgi:general L-amino acid transport system permease protein
MTFLSDQRARAIFWQVLFLAGIVGFVGWLVFNASANLSSRRITTGFAFLFREAGFAISEPVLGYSSTDTYLRALVVGVINTVRVSLIAIVLATLLGTLIGIIRVGRNWVLIVPAGWFIEVMRNVPLVVQLLFWYGLFTIALPPVREAIEPLPGIYLANRGLYLPALSLPWHLALLLVCAIATGIVGLARGLTSLSGKRRSVFLSVIGLGLSAAIIVANLDAVSTPELRGLNFRGGYRLSPELAALIVGLTLYTSGFIAEVVRSGILSVSKGQAEAGLALGLAPATIMRMIIMPQALRVVIPPMASQYINTFKNSSLAVVIAFPDIVSIANTTMNQTNQAIEGVLIVITTFLLINLTIASLMNLLNRAVALKER